MASSSDADARTALPMTPADVERIVNAVLRDSNASSQPLNRERLMARARRFADEHWRARTGLDAVAEHKKRA